MGVLGVEGMRMKGYEEYGRIIMMMERKEVFKVGGVM